MKTYYKQVCILYPSDIQLDMPPDIHEKLNKYNYGSGYYGDDTYTLYVAKGKRWDDGDMEAVLAWFRSLECKNRKFWEIMAIDGNDTPVLHETGSPEGITRLSLSVTIRCSRFPTVHLDDFF